jgi:hypothetical protein
LNYNIRFLNDDEEDMKEFMKAQKGSGQTPQDKNASVLGE